MYQLESLPPSFHTSITCTLEHPVRSKGYRPRKGSDDYLHSDGQVNSWTKYRESARDEGGSLARFLEHTSIVK